MRLGAAGSLLESVAVMTSELQRTMERNESVLMNVGGCDKGRRRSITND